MNITDRTPRYLTTISLVHDKARLAEIRSYLADTHYRVVLMGRGPRGKYRKSLARKFGANTARNMSQSSLPISRAPRADLYLRLRTRYEDLMWKPSFDKMLAWMTKQTRRNLKLS